MKEFVRLKELAKQQESGEHKTIVVQGTVHEENMDWLQRSKAGEVLQPMEIESIFSKFPRIRY